VPSAIVSCENQGGVRPTRLNRLLTEEEWAEVIRPDLAAGTASYISAGRKLLEAKQQLKKQGGSFIDLVENRLGWDVNTVEKWMKIAGHPVLTDSETLQNLPTAWTTLYQLSRLPRKVLEGYIADGTVHSQLSCRTAAALVKRGRGSLSSTAAPGKSGTEPETSSEPENETHQNGSAAPENSSVVNPESIQAAVQEDVGPNSRCEIDRKLARLEQLERERRQWEIQRHGYEGEVQELQAKLGPETNLRHPRKLFRRALETLQKSDAPKLLEKDRRALINSAVTDLIELIRSLERDGLKIERLDLFCRLMGHGGPVPKRKGTHVERELVNQLVELGLPCFRVPLSGAAGGQWSGDIHVPLLGRTRRVEVKARGDGFRHLYSWLDNFDLLIVKADRRNPLAVLPLALMVELMLAAEHGSKMSAANDEACPAP
jgi:hypothetical protein